MTGFCKLHPPIRVWWALQENAMRKYAVPICLLVAVFVGIPCMVAFRDTKAVHYHYGDLADANHLQCIATDRTHIDNYRCVIFNRDNESRATHDNGVILVDGLELKFPAATNVAVLSPSNALRFLEISPDQVQPTSGGDSGVIYIGGHVPKFKDFDFGIPNEKFVMASIADW